MKKFYIAGGVGAMAVLAVALVNSSMLSEVKQSAVPLEKVGGGEKAATTQAQKARLGQPETDIATDSANRLRRDEQAPQAELFDQTANPLPQAVTSAKRSPEGATFLPSTTSRVEPVPNPPQYVGRDQFEDIEDNPVKLTAEEPVSTFSIDVDTSAYSFMRRQLNQGVLPQPDSIRVEELINYFDYDYPLPESKTRPFEPTVAMYETPWNEDTRLLHIGIKGHDIVPEEKPRSNLVFLIDTSGSMASQDKLPLLLNGFKLMVENLDPEDTVAIATYAGSAGVALEPTKVKEKQKILSALSNLRSGGSTAGAAGIKLAYQLAEQHFDEQAINRVMLATDGDFNVGIQNKEELKGYIERQRESGVFLSVVGFGQGNYNDALMQALAQNGNGTAAYIDSLSEARKLLVDEASSTLFPIAKDVKIQVEFNPARVAEYRLIGYQTRQLNREDFNNDAVDAGEIGAGHTVTAIYEITPAGSDGTLVDPLRYGENTPETQETKSEEIAFLKMRYKLPEEDTSRLIERPITRADAKAIDATSEDIRFAAAVAAFGQKLRGGKYLKDYSYEDIIALALSSKGEDRFGYRAEFINLVRLAKSAEAM